MKLLPYSDTFIQVLDEAAPSYALNTHCHAGGGALTIDEAGDAGEFFANHLAGWSGIPISLTVPVTVFIVVSINDRAGCSLGPLTDYIVLRASGVKDSSLMAHELGHACYLVWHSGSNKNLMWPDNTRGEKHRRWKRWSRQSPSTPALSRCRSPPLATTFHELV